MDYPYRQRLPLTFKGLHGFANLKKNGIKYLKSFTVQIVFRAYSKLVIYSTVADLFHIPIHALCALLFWDGMENPFYNKPMFYHSLVILNIYFSRYNFLLKFTDELLRLYQFPRMRKDNIFVDFLHEIC